LTLELKRQVVDDLKKTVIDLAAREKEISRKDVEEVLKISQTISGLIIKNLVNKGILQALGGGKNTRYIVIN